MLEKDGIATRDLIEGVYPSEERRRRGAFAVIECFQHIPCNPCFSSCPRGAISVPDICDLPKVDFDKCNGCGLCAVVCPGLAIFIIDETYSDSETLIKLPYEFLPLPEAGAEVSAANRAGEVVCTATVKKVVNAPSQNRTPMVWLAVKKEFAAEVRSFFPITSTAQPTSTTTQSTQPPTTSNSPTANSATSSQSSASHTATNPTSSSSTDPATKGGACGHGCVKLGDINERTLNGAYVCRCEELTVGEIRGLIAKGYTTLDEIKRVSRAGMGACQGRTCRQLIMNEIASITGTKQDEQFISTFRPTAAPIKMGLLLRNREDK